MTDKEKAIIMAHTGVVMLSGDKFIIFLNYVENLLNKRIWTHELVALSDEIREKSRNDFIKLCEKSMSECDSCEDAISRKALIERINKAEDDFKADNMEIIASGGDSFVDGVLSGVFNIREMVRQAQSVCKSESEEK